MACLNAPTLISGGFRWHFLLAIPITSCVTLGVAYIPIAGSTFGVAANVMVGLLSSFVLIAVVNSQFIATPEHKKLNQSVGPPVVATGFLFFGLIFLYITLTAQYSSSAIGLLLPAAEAILKFSVLLVLTHSCCKHYYEPKANFLAQFELTKQANAANPETDRPSAPGASSDPPLRGDIEVVYGNITAGLAIVVGNATFAATLVEVLVTPDSQGWIVGIVTSSVQGIFVGTGLVHRCEMWAIARLKLDSRYYGGRTALDEIFTHSGGSSAASIVVLSIGCLRAATFGDVRAIVWYDVSPLVVWVMLAQVSCGFVSSVLVEALNRFCGLGTFVTRSFPPGHPLCYASERRNFELSSYVFTLGMCCSLIYLCFLVFLDPEFVTGISRGFNPAGSDIWVQPLAVRLGVTNSTELAV
jgi:hypothetical protein